MKFLVCILSLALVGAVFANDPPKDLDVGVYVAHGSEWLEFPVEIVNWQSGGVVKFQLTGGIVKGDINGRIRGGSSSLRLSRTSDIEIIIHTMEGVSAQEYQLLKFRQHSDAREFRSVTGGVFHVSGGAQRDTVDFTARKIGSRLFRVLVGDLPPGEYAFVPPVNSASLAASGKAYTFQTGPESISGRPHSQSVLKTLFSTAPSEAMKF